MRATNRLTTKQIEALQAGKFNDGAGLWLVKVNETQGKWVYRFTIHGKRREMGLGSLQEVSLKTARQAAEQWREYVRAGKDPIKERDKLQCVR